MKSIVLVLCLLGLTQVAAAQDPIDHQCFRAARSIAVNKLNKEAGNKELDEAGMAHDYCKWNESVSLIQCYLKGEAFTEYQPESVWIKRVSPTRNDLEFSFLGGVPGLDLNVLVRFSSTKKAPCKYLNSELEISYTAEE